VYYTTWPRLLNNTRGSTLMTYLVTLEEKKSCWGEKRKLCRMVILLGKKIKNLSIRNKWWPQVIDCRLEKINGTANNLLISSIDINNNKLKRWLTTCVSIILLMMMIRRIETIYIRDQKQVKCALSDCYWIQNNMSTIIGENQASCDAIFPRMMYIHKFRESPWWISTDYLEHDHHTREIEGQILSPFSCIRYFFFLC